MDDKYKRVVEAMQHKLNALENFEKDKSMKRIWVKLHVGKGIGNDWCRNRKTIEEEKTLSAQCTFGKPKN